MSPASRFRFPVYCSGLAGGCLDVQGHAGPCDDGSLETEQAERQAETHLGTCDACGAEGVLLAKGFTHQDSGCPVWVESTCADGCPLEVAS